MYSDKKKQTQERKDGSMTNQDAFNFVVSCWRREQAYTKLTESLMEEIVKDCNEHKPAKETLVKCIRCIAAGTGNVVFARQCLERINEDNS